LYRARFSCVHIGGLPSNQDPPLLNHNRFKRFNKFEDGHLGSVRE
jgi:hypothetical protein